MAQKSILVMAVLLLLSLVPSGFAFDGYRSGFILGFGLGPGITSFTQTVGAGTTSLTSDRENTFGIHTDFRIGGGINEQVQIYWISKVAWFSMDNIYGSSVTVANGMGGLGVTYYLLPQSPSWYFTGGLGFSTWALPFESNSDTWYGLGMSGGAGYEFSPHWSVDLSFTYGNPNKDVMGINVKTNALSIKACINVLGY